MNKKIKNPKLILGKVYGSYVAYPATKENAMRMFEAYRENIDPEILKIAESKKHTYITSEQICAICSEVFSTPIGEKLKTSDVINTKEIIAELSVLMIETNLNKVSFADKYIINEERFQKFKEFSLVKKLIDSVNSEVKFLMYSDYLSVAYEYSGIKKDNWKEGVEEYKIAQHIINFINQNLVSSNEEFEIVDLVEKYS